MKVPCRIASHNAEIAAVPDPLAGRVLIVVADAEFEFASIAVATEDAVRLAHAILAAAGFGDGETT